MQDPDAPARPEPGSLAPVQIDNSDDDEVAKLRGSQKLKLMLALGVLAVAAVGGTHLLKALDEHSAYTQAAAELERIDTEQASAFLRCALPNAQRSQLSTANGLRGAFELASEHMDKAYAKALGKCTPLFERFEESIKTLKAPADVAPRLGAVSQSVAAFAAAWDAYRAHLQKPGDPAGEAPSAAPHIDKLTATWQSYQEARDQARQSIASRL